jgi:hypothetical protein
MNNQQQNDTRKPNFPTHIAYQIREREGKKSIWTRIGSAWTHSDNAGFSIQVEAVPLDGRITLRLVTEKEN